MARQRGEQAEYFTVAQVRKALIEGRGVMAEAGRILKRRGKPMSRRYVAEYVSRHPELQELLEEVNETHLDVVESRLFQQIEAGDPSQIRFFLSTRGRHRGYVRATEVSGPNGGPVKTETVLRSEDLKKLSDEELELYQALQAKMQDNAPA